MVTLTEAIQDILRGTYLPSQLQVGLLCGGRVPAELPMRWLALLPCAGHAAALRVLAGSAVLHACALDKAGLASAVGH